jgi:hypothetical protein
MTTKGPPLQYEVASNEELEAYLAEPGLKGAVLHKKRYDTIMQANLAYVSVDLSLGILVKEVEDASTPDHHQTCWYFHMLHSCLQHAKSQKNNLASMYDIY